MIIILHDSKAEASRNFVATYGEGYQVIDWGNPDDKSKADAYQISNYPQVSAFPSLVDTESRGIVREPVDLITGLETLKKVGFVTKLKISDRLTAIGKKADVKAALATNADMADRWDYATEIDKQDICVRQLFTNLNINPDEVLY